MMRLHWVPFLSVLAISWLAFGQITYPICTAAGWEWSYNSLNQNPCYVAASLESTCSRGKFNIPPLLSSFRYVGPYSGHDNLCQCNTVVYSLMSACSGCQGSTWISWSLWSYNCTAESLPSTYPDAIPAETHVPHWAYLNVMIVDNWNATMARSASDRALPSTVVLVSTAAPVSTITNLSRVQASPTASAAAQGSSQNKSHSGEIAGAVVGSVVAASLLIGITFWYLRRRHWRAEAQSAPFANKSAHMAEEFGLPNLDHSASIGKYHDPSDPSTYPKPFLSPSMSEIQTTHGSERGHGGGSIDPSHNRQQYMGLPHV